MSYFKDSVLFNVPLLLMTTTCSGFWSIWILELWNIWTVTLTIMEAYS